MSYKLIRETDFGSYQSEEEANKEADKLNNNEKEKGFSHITRFIVRKE